MRTILCGQQKGGVGKSTIAANLAVALATQGRSVIIIDTDKQQTCGKWASRRKLAGIEPEVAYAHLVAEANNPKAFIETVNALKGRKAFDDCIIDAGGRDNRELRLSLLVSDILIAPTLPSQADIESLEEFDTVVGEAMTGNLNLRAITVVSKAATGLNFPREILFARQAIEEAMNHLPIPQATITERPNLRRYWSEGKTAFDEHSESALKAQTEFNMIIQAL